MEMADFDSYHNLDNNTFSVFLKPNTMHAQDQNQQKDFFQSSFDTLIGSLFQSFGAINCHECRNENTSLLYDGLLNGTLLL